MRSTILFCLTSCVIGCNNSIPEDTSPEVTESGLSSAGEEASIPEQDPGSDSETPHSEASDSGDPDSGDPDSDSGSPDSDFDNSGSDQPELEPEEHDPEDPTPDEAPGDSLPPPVDADEDGWFSDEDCDDRDDRIHPGAPEFCDGIDTDCDGRIDPPDAVDAQIWFRDADNDGFGTPLDTIPSCVHPGPVWVENDQDCDDTNREVHPDAVEICDGIDNDCDGVIDPDDSFDAVEWFLDEDGDGHGGTEESYVACASLGAEWVSVSDDCDDMSGAIYPGAMEYCDGVDSDCSGDEDAGIATFFHGSSEPRDVTEELTGGTFYVADVGRLRVCEGEWSGRVLIDAEITTGSTSTFTVEGIGDVVLDANGEGSVIEVLGGIDELNVFNIQLSGGEASRGGGISAESMDLVLHDVALTLNTASEIGGAIYVNEGRIVMRRSELMENVSEGVFLGGGAVYVGIGEVNIETSTLSSNHAEGSYANGGAVFLLLGDISVTNSVIEHNTAGLSGGGVNIGQGSLKADGSIFEENEALNGGGAYVGGDVFMTDSLFLMNRSTGPGGALFLNSSASWVMLDCQSVGTGPHGFLRNEAGGTGSALHISNSLFSTVLSDQCDWGVGTADNLDEDLRLGPFDGEAGANASFVCEGTDCSGDIGMVVSP